MMPPSQPVKMSKMRKRKLKVDPLKLRTARTARIADQRPASRGAGEGAVIKAWLVIAADGFEAVFKDRAAAERYAAHTHGTLHALVLKEASS